MSHSIKDLYISEKDREFKKKKKNSIFTRR